MISIVDTIFEPLLTWLTSIYDMIRSLSVPVSRPLNLSNFFGYFRILGPVWATCITTTIALAVIYFVVYVIMKNIGVLLKFKSMVKWW